MRKICVKIALLLLLVPAFCVAQQNQIDIWHKALRSAHTDSARHFSLIRLAYYYEEINRDTSLYYFDAALPVAIKNNKAIDEAFSLDNKGYLLMGLGKYPESLQCFQLGLKLAEETENENKTWNINYAGVYAAATDINAGGLKNFTPHKNRLDILANIHHDFGHLMGSTNNIDQQIIQYRQTQLLAAEVNDYPLLGGINVDLGEAYLALNRLDTALIFEQNAERIAKQHGFTGYLGFVYENMGNIYLKKGNKNLAIQYFHKAIKTDVETKTFSSASTTYADLSSYYLSEKQKDSSLYYAKKTLETLKSMGSKALDQAYENLYKSYSLTGNTDSAYKYQGLALTAKDSIYQATTKSLADFQKQSFQAQIHAQDLEKEKAATQTRTRTTALIAGIVVLLLLSGVFYRNDQKEKKAKNILQDKNKVIEQTLNHLKATQTQLIQSEKMASLGELTAGIAHEIQNPLNFVNNFSEVSAELLDEMDEELNKGDIQEAKTIGADLKQNLEKIKHHGQRAGFIVKGMLEHSRTNTGEKQLTDMNVLCDEFLKLSYQGLRAKDKNFSAEMITHFDPNLPKVNVSQQDMGRVMLNLFNNAFYAVNQKLKTAGTGYKPEVIVTTSVENGQVVIGVKDNGGGIPDSIKDKIMQPFFTTKPTGEGTGLGLSLTYDMVVKGHEGSINVESVEGEGSKFTIKLPITL